MPNPSGTQEPSEFAVANGARTWAAKLLLEVCFRRFGVSFTLGGLARASMKNKQTTAFAIGLLALAGFIVFFFGIGRKAKAPKLRSPLVTYSSFSPLHSFSSNRWSAGVHAHADLFVPKISGRLRTIEVAVEPSSVRKGWEKTAGDLDLFLTQDENGFPGTVLERFSLIAGAAASPLPTLPLLFKSVTQPKLHAGEKYWLGAKSTGLGGWTWHFGDRTILQKSARENEQGKWVSAGDFCYVGAFSVIVTTNQDLEAEPR